MMEALHLSSLFLFKTVIDFVSVSYGDSIIIVPEHDFSKWTDQQTRQLLRPFDPIVTTYNASQ